ncbi:MAG: DEAD/DEAH box helicase [Planctomycetes bacterium]|nr:DEAD/DEAH box helicase [Planctomycetota bacterium]
MFVLHANWSGSALHLWGESLSAARLGHTASRTAAHPWGTAAKDLTAALDALDAGLGSGTPDTLRLLLPHLGGAAPQVLPSSKLAALLGRVSDDAETLTLEPCTVPSIRVAASHALDRILKIRSALASADGMIAAGHDLEWWYSLADFSVNAVADQRVVPTVIQEQGGGFRGQWRPWLNDSDTNESVADLIASMPAVVRAVDGADGQAWPIVDGFLAAATDSLVRDSLVAETYEDSIEACDPTTDPHVSWLTGLVRSTDAIRTGRGGAFDLLRGARGWLGLLDEAREARALCLGLRLEEPALDAADTGIDATWRVHFMLVDPETNETVIDASALFSRGDARRRGAAQARDEELSGMLLQELARASRIWTELDDALEEERPTGIDLDTRRAYQFMREMRPILLEAGFVVEIPSWWGESTSRINAHLLIDSPDELPPMMSQGARGAALGGGLQSLVGYRWQVTLGSQVVSVDMLERLAANKAPLVRIGGQWIDLRPEDIESALRFLRGHPGGTMTLIEALRMANGIDGPPEALPVAGIQATGWVRQLIAGDDGSESFRLTEAPSAFKGTLRPYQLSGLSWLAFLDRLGLGGCLADDMGLGKTIQLIALLQHERAVSGGQPVGPTLLVTPMSVMGNWRRELQRFSPELRVHIQHGLDRPAGERLRSAAESADVVLTTYAITVRDKDDLQSIPWRRVVLDEAQYIKNPPTKQTAAIRAIQSQSRIALTGTPVENRLAELWSILEFCCPGYLGSQPDFRRRFAVPIERNRDPKSGERLRHLVRPFVLRRLKTDRTVISDLPPLVEARQHITLSDEQTRLYEQVVKTMLQQVDQAEGIRRRGLILSALVKLKQICNHPSHYLGEVAPVAAAKEANAADGGKKIDRKKPAGKRGAQQATAKPAALPSDETLDPLDAIDAQENLAAPIVLPPAALEPARSGKTQRLMEMLDEIVAAGDSALVFTQYRAMGHLLVAMIRQVLDVDALFLHGGTAQGRRDELVERFQRGDGSTPIFVLSLKAGGVGLNLTAANHVIHFDRWWNPAVENQATDRAFRIGQTRTVNVHKYVCTGTLEERIDQMIEQKTELAANIIGAGDAWLTELSTGQLKDLLSLRRTGMEGGE